MGDEGFDPCECIWSHEFAMRRLISLLRQSQAYCTDNECFSEIPGSGNNEPNSFIMMAMCWFVVAVVLFFLRPTSLRRREVEGKPKDNGQGSDNRPPPLC